MVQLYIQNERAENAAMHYRLLGTHSAGFAHITPDATAHNLGIKAATKLGDEEHA